MIGFFFLKVTLGSGAGVQCQARHHGAGHDDREYCQKSIKSPASREHINISLEGPRAGAP